MSRETLGNLSGTKVRRVKYATFELEKGLQPYDEACAIAEVGIAKIIVREAEVATVLGVSALVDEDTPGPRYRFRKDILVEEAA